jgi:hypothetical protein
MSARSLYEDVLPSKLNILYYQSSNLLHVHIDKLKEWKHRTFLRIADFLDRDLITNIVVIGDSQIEIEAGINF